MAEYNPSKIIKDGNTYNFRDTTKIPLAGSNEISGSLIPSTDGTVNLGSSSYQWNNAYIKSLTINGTQFLPSDYVTLSSLSTVATSGSYNDLSNKPTIPTVNNGTLTIQQNGTTVDSFSANSSTDKTVNIQCVDLTSNQTVGGNKEFTGATTAHDLMPSATDTYNLGTSTNKWKSFNGINPGALSLPSNNAVNILSELQSDGYIAPSNGYVRAIKNVQTECASTIGIRNETTGIEDRRITERRFVLGVIVPVQAGEKVIISDNWNSVSDATVTYGAYFCPCQGNV